MAFEVTANRKRPQSFDELVGQDFTVATLKSALEQNRIAHAYLFSGPRGVGKTSAARILAKSLNCENGPAAQPCGACSACREITAASSLDVIEIDGASNTSVNDVREIRDEVLFAPNSSRYKVYIIDEVHMLSNSAFNALLKTIEEPPPYVVFVFATTEIHRVPATIRSRCQQFNFRLISLETIKACLAKAADEAGQETEEAALLWIAKESTGSLRDAYTLFDQIASFSEGAITLEKIREKLGIVGLDRMNDLVGRLVEGDGRGALDLVATILDQGVAVEQFVVDLAEYFRCLLFLKRGITRESLLGFPPESFPEEYLGGLKTIQIEQGLDILLAVHRELRTSLNPRFDLELVVSRLARISRFVTAEDVLAQIRTLRQELERGIAHEQDADADVIKDIEVAPSTQPEPQELISALRRDKPALTSAIEKAMRMEVDDERLLLVYSRSDRYSGDAVAADRETVLEKAHALFGKQLRLEVEYQDDEEKPGDHPVLDEKVEIVRRVFKGRVVEGD
jgi:DNA polymerase-3 subunit gamma/tau